MALAVIFAMLASFILSFTLVPTLAKYILVRPRCRKTQKGRRPQRGKAGGESLLGFRQKLKHHLGIFSRFQEGFEARFLRFCGWYGGLLERTIENRRRFVTIMLAFALVSLILFYFNGRDFFPEVRSGTIQMHMRGPLGTRMEATNRITTLVSDDIQRMLPGQVEGVISNCGLPVGPHNLAFIPTPTIGSQDCDLTINLYERQISGVGYPENYP